MSESKSGLKPCPFCGDEAWMHSSHPFRDGKIGHRIECEGSCHAMTCWWHKKDEAIHHWNRRAAPPTEAPDAGMDCGTEFDRWYATQQHQLSNKETCRVIWQKAWACARIAPPTEAHEYSEGICGDGAAILCDGQPLTITEVLQRLNAPSAPPAEAPERSVVDDLAMVVGSLAHSLRQANPEHSLPDRAVDFLRRHGLQGSPLRDSAKVSDLNLYTSSREEFPDWRTWEKIELAESEVPGWSELEKYIFGQLKIYEGWDDGESAYTPTDKDRYLIWDFISGLICDDGFFDVVCRVNDPAQDELARLEREIADRSAIRALNKCAVIENGLPTGWFVAEWCNEISFRYLDLRGLLERHPTDKNLVRVRGEFMSQQIFAGDMEVGDAVEFMSDNQTEKGPSSGIVIARRGSLVVIRHSDHLGEVFKVKNLKVSHLTTHHRGGPLWQLT